MCIRPIAGLTQSLQSVLPDGVQQAEPRLGALRFRPDQAAVHERAEGLDERPGMDRVLASGVPADGLGRRQAKRSGEYA